MRVTPRIGVALTALALALTGCTSSEAATPIPIPRTEDAVKAVDMSHLPEAVAPAKCSGYVALTFDDGPTEVTTDLLAVLDHYSTPASFFNIGSAEETSPRLVEREISGGHQVGNHTSTHPDLLTQNVEAALADVEEAASIHSDLGFDDQILFRPPYGNTSPEIRAAIESRGMTEVLWTVDSKDYEAKTAEEVVEASKGMTDGGILLLHDGKSATLEALPSIIKHYYSQNFCFGQIEATESELSTDLPGFTHRARAVKQE